MTWEILLFAAFLYFVWKVIRRLGKAIERDGRRGARRHTLGSSPSRSQTRVRINVTGRNGSPSLRREPPPPAKPAEQDIVDAKWEDLP